MGNKLFKMFDGATINLLGVDGATVLEILRVVLKDGNLMEFVGSQLDVSDDILRRLSNDVERVTGMVSYGDLPAPDVEDTILYLDDVIHGDPKDYDVMEVTITGKAARDIRAIADQIREGKQE